MAAGRQVWEVVGGGEKGGIVVRQGEALNSPLVQERLQTGALVQERTLAGERLHFDRLTGAGPSTGWVSLRLTSGKEMMSKATGLWEVVGGGDKGGILVRMEKDVSSPQAPDRLSTGALVRQLALEGERLHYQRLTGTGPANGWVSIKLKDTEKALMTRVGGAATVEADAAPPLAQAPLPPPRPPTPVLLSEMPERPTGPVTGRKIRIVGIHATPANSNIMKFQCSQLRKALGTDAEWLFVDGPTPWQPAPGSPWPNDAERSEFEKRLAQNKPFVQWYHTAFHGDGSGNDDWQFVDECVMHLWEFFAREAPVDIVVAFSQGSSMVSILIEMMRRAGQEAPWRANVLFNGGNVDDGRYQFQVPCSLPTVYVAGGQADPYHDFILALVYGMYTNLTLIEHEDGHSFPGSQPRANEVYEQVAGLIRRTCGLCEAKPQVSAAKRPPAKACPQAPEDVATSRRNQVLGDQEDMPPGKWTVDYIGQARGPCKGCSCEWYQWNPNKLRPERGDDGDATITEWFLNDYDSLRCQACKCKFSDHKSLGPVNKPAGYHPGLNEADVNALMS